MEYYFTIKRNEVLIQVTTWINLENVMLSERRQTQKATYCMTALICNIQNRQTQRGKQMSGCQRLVTGMGAMKVSCRQMVTQLCECTKDHRMIHFQRLIFMIWIIPQ